MKRLVVSYQQIGGTASLALSPSFNLISAHSKGVDHSLRLQHIIMREAAKKKKNTIGVPRIISTRAE
jgi:hypothetical protein